jgi:small subunit ribosomal protein S17
MEENKTTKKKKITCTDKFCPKHGHISIRGRTFKGKVISKNPKRIAIEFERTLYIKKYERYAKKKTKLHARLPDCMSHEINIGDYIEIRECRPISKIIHFIVVGKLISDKRKSSEEQKKRETSDIKIKDKEKIR